jgi:hypothetical protein
MMKRLLLALIAAAAVTFAAQTAQADHGCYRPIIRPHFHHHHHHVYRPYGYSPYYGRSYGYGYPYGYSCNPGFSFGVYGHRGGLYFGF